MTPRLLVLGGGIAGLSAAYDLSRRADTEVIVLEASDRLGGSICTEQVDGVPVEAGADSFLARAPALGLCESLGLSRELVRPAVFGAQLWIDGRLRRPPPGSLLGVPPSALTAGRSGVLTPRGAARVLLESCWPRRLSGPDVPLGPFVTRRLGREVLDRLVDPLLAGTRSGRPEELSLAAAAPELDRIAREHRSVTGALRRRTRAEPSFCSLIGGLETLVAALKRSLHDVRLQAPAEHIALRGAGLEVTLASGEELAADGVVVATPAPVASRLLAAAAPAAASALRAIPYTPATVVTLVYPPGALRPPSGGSGVLVPRAAGSILTACTWYSLKWPSAALPGGGQIVRCFAGRAGGEEVGGLSDETLTERLQSEVSALVGSAPEPRSALITRFEQGFPQYVMGHLDRVTRAEAGLRDLPIRLAGASYRGVGIPDCIAGGRAAARSLRDALLV